MSDKSITQIRAEHARRATGILNGYRDGLDALRRKREPEGVEYMTGLDGGQKMEVLGRQKKEAANEAYAKTLAAYRAELERYHGEIKSRRPAVEERLFAMPAADAVGMLSQAALASEEELGNLLDVGVAARNDALIRTALVAAERRGFAEVVVKALDAAPDEVRETYHEWKDLPAQEILDRQSSSVDRIVEAPNLDQLVYTATGTT